MPGVFKKHKNLFQIRNPRGLDENDVSDLLESLIDRCQQYVGGPVIFELIDRCQVCRHRY